jgi:hypothetical protein
MSDPRSSSPEFSAIPRYGASLSPRYSATPEYTGRHRRASGLRPVGPSGSIGQAGTYGQSMPAEANQAAGTVTPGPWPRPWSSSGTGPWPNAG